MQFLSSFCVEVVFVCPHPLFDRHSVIVNHTFFSPFFFLNFLTFLLVHVVGFFFFYLFLVATRIDQKQQQMNTQGLKLQYLYIIYKMND